MRHQLARWLALASMAFADMCDREVIALHGPVRTGECEPPFVVCANHYGRARHGYPPYPCKAVTEATQRVAERVERRKHLGCYPGQTERQKLL